MTSTPGGKLACTFATSVTPLQQDEFVVSVKLNLSLPRAAESAGQEPGQPTMKGNEMAERMRYDGVMAARVDRLPLTRVQWQLAILVEVTWGFIIFDTDGIGARLYPFVWRPNHIIDVVQYAIIQALQVGLGILLGVYIMSYIADRYGRRPAI